MAGKYTLLQLQAVSWITEWFHDSLPGGFRRPICRSGNAPASVVRYDNSTLNATNAMDEVGRWRNRSRNEIDDRGDLD
jgi:hypothetical protein